MTTKEELWHILSDLTDEQFKQFKWFLKDAEDDFTAIPAAGLDKADQQDTVDLMVQKYGTVTKALQKTTKTLEKIHRNDLVQSLLKPKSRQRNAKNIDSGQEAKLEEMKTKMKLMIQERKMKIGEIQSSAALSWKSAERQISDSMNAFTDLIQSVQRSMTKVTDEIKEKQKTTQEQAEGLIQELKREISELSKAEAELEKLRCAEDIIRLSHSFSSKKWTEVSFPQPSYEESVTTAVDKLKETLNRELKLFLRKAELNRIKQFAVDVTLDPNTAHPNLVLSEDRKEVYCGNVRRKLPDNPERFNNASNVLGKQSFSSGRFYFQVQVEGKTAWDLGVVKESICRKGSIKAGPGEGYWTICLRNGEMYKAAGAHLNVKPPLNRVGVFVDCGMGFISFYNVDSAELIHKFTDVLFKEKLYPFFSPSNTQNGLNTTPLVLYNVS